MSMIKVVRSDAYDDTVGLGLSLWEPGPGLKKQASTVFGCEYADIMPDKDHVGVHAVILGDYEHFGLNRNYDGFPKAACQKYHPTFVKYGKVYRHHRNKDPEKALGQIVKSAYIENMGTIHLFSHVHKEKARDELHKLATTGEIPFSMACKVPRDRCTICNTYRKDKNDDQQCDHVRYEFGKQAEDGTVVGTQNDEPLWFDKSFVTRPADRIAWSLKVAGTSSVDLAEAQDIWVPDDVELISGLAGEKSVLLDKYAEYETRYAGIAENGPRDTQDMYLLTMAKSAGQNLDSKSLDRLRQYKPGKVFQKLADIGYLLSPEDFFKYAFGPTYGELEPYMPRVLKSLPYVFTDIKSAGIKQLVCCDNMFDPDTNSSLDIDPGFPVDQEDQSYGGFAEKAAVFLPEITFVKKSVDNSRDLCSTTDIVTGLCLKYAAYLLSAGVPSRDTESLAAAAAARTCVQK
jgi:hypothetical protein